MNILLINPKVSYILPNEKKESDVLTKIFGEIPSLTLPQVAASTPGEHNIQIIDENYEKLDIKNNADIVGITCFTMSAPRAYEIADKYKSIGVPVILGGNHPTALPDEAKKHADAVVVGEAENTWPQLILDFQKGQMKPFYISNKNVSNEEIPEPRRDLISKKMVSNAIMINRGCPNRCEFCTITSTYNRTVRPIEKVLEEVKKIKSKSILIYDSNFTVNIKYNKRLLEELIKFKKKWLASGTINVLGDDEELLKIAKEAGLFSWCIGFESISQKSIDEANKKTNQVDMYLSAINKIKENGMAIFGTFIFGFDNDTPDIFENTYNTINKWNLGAADFHILTPLPGTPLYERLKKEDRIITEDWSKYNCINVIYQPKNMSVEELYEGTRWISKKYYSISNIIKRFFNTFEKYRDISLANYILQLNFSTRLRYKTLFDF